MAKDYSEFSKKKLIKLSDGGDVEATRFMGYRYEDSDSQKALAYYREAEAEGSKQAIYLLGMYYYNHNDPATAFKYIDRAAKNTIPEAMIQLGIFYGDGIGCLQNSNQAYTGLS